MGSFCAWFAGWNDVARAGLNEGTGRIGKVSGIIGDKAGERLMAIVAKIEAVLIADDASIVCNERIEGC